MSAAIIVTGVLVLVVGCAIGVIVLSLSKHENAVKNFLSIILPTVILAFLAIIIGCSVSSYRELWLMFKYDDVRVFDYAGDTPTEVDELTAAGYTVVYKENYVVNTYRELRHYTLLYMVKDPTKVDDQYKKLIEE